MCGVLQLKNYIALSKLFGKKRCILVGLTTHDNASLQPRIPFDTYDWNGPLQPESRDPRDYRPI